jgi:large subunit ribosomal protein L6
VSRIGKHAVTVPSGVEVAVAGQQVTVKGALGQLSHVMTDEVEVTRDGDDVWVKPRAEDTRSRAMWGMSRTVVNNMVIGVSEGFTRNLEINGVGYRAAIDGKLRSTANFSTSSSATVTILSWRSPTTSKSLARDRPPSR